MSDTDEEYNVTFSDILDNEDVLEAVMDSYLNKPTQKNIDNGVFKMSHGVGGAPIVWVLTCKQMHQRYKQKYPGPVRTLLYQMQVSREMLNLAHSIGGPVHIYVHGGRSYTELPHKLGRYLLCALAANGDQCFALQIFYEAMNEPEKLPDWMHDTGVFDDGDTAFVDAAAGRRTDFLVHVLMVMYGCHLSVEGIYNFFRWNNSNDAFVHHLYNAKVVKNRKWYHVVPIPSRTGRPFKLDLRELLPDTDDMVAYAQAGYNDGKHSFPNRMKWLVEFYGM